MIRGRYETTATRFENVTNKHGLDFDLNFGLNRDLRNGVFIYVLVNFVLNKICVTKLIYYKSVYLAGSKSHKT